jgi:hypothetical protein
LPEIKDEAEGSPSVAAYVTVDLTELKATAGMEVPPAYAAQLLHVCDDAATGMLLTAAPLLSSTYLAHAGQPPWLIAGIAVAQVVAITVHRCMSKSSMTLKPAST